MRHGSVVNIRPKQKSSFECVHTHLRHSSHGSLPWILIPPDCLVLVNTEQVFLAPLLIKPKDHFADKGVAGVFQNPESNHRLSLKKSLSYKITNVVGTVANRTLDYIEPFNKLEKYFEDGKSESTRTSQKEAMQKVIWNEILLPTNT